MVPYGSENFKMLLLQLLFFFSQTFSECCKYGNFKNQPVSPNTLPVERK